MVTEYQKEQQKIDRASLGVSVASLMVGIAALCLNEKTKESKNMAATKTAKEVRKQKRDKKKEYVNEIRAHAVDIGCTSPVIVLNTENGERRFRLVPVKERETKAKPKASARKSWVAMGINTRTGKDIQAIVCDTRKEAEERARSMKMANRSPYAEHGFALVDTGRQIDVPSYFGGSMSNRLNTV